MVSYTTPPQVATAVACLRFPGAERIRRGLADERERWALWLPVFLGGGVGTYFALPAEPPVAASFVLAVLGMAVPAFGRRRTMGIVGVALLAFAAGFAAAQWRTVTVDAPVLERTIAAASVSGRVVTVEPAARGPRVVLEDVAVAGLAPDDTPERVRLRLRARTDGFRPGDRISVRARLAPPPSAAWPGGFDFSRQAWFQRLGAVGFALGTARIAPRAETQTGPARRGSSAVERARAAVAQRIMERIEGPAGGVAAALATGLRGGVTAEVREQMRDSGLAHLLAISGLHLGLVAGFVFALVRGALALWPALALRVPAKKIAAATALLAAGGYLLLAGATIPTQRAFVMAAIVLVAVLVDRTGISLRLIAWAAAVVLLLRPESLLSASFQMSFAAAVALVAAYEVAAPRLRGRTAGMTIARRMLLYLAAVAFSTVIASLATAPFAIFHFNRLAALGLVANMAAVPIAAFWVMPLEVVALVLMPFGLDGFVLPLLGAGVEAILFVAATVSAWQWAAISVPAMTPAGLLAIVGGGLWLALWRRRWRHAGFVGVAAGLMTIGGAPAPDILVSERTRLVAVRTHDGVWRISDTRREAFVRDMWARRLAIDGFAPFPDPGAEAGGLRCDASGCVASVGARTVAFVRNPDAFPEDCRAADIVVAAVPAPRWCAGPERVLDFFDTWRAGAHAVRLSDPSAPAVWRAREGYSARPWHRAATR